MTLITLESHPCISCSHREACRAGLACEAFVSFVETGTPSGDSTPRFDLYAQLYPGAVTLRVLQRHWKSEGAKRAGATMRGERRKLSKADTGRRWRSHLKIIWQLDPGRREFELARKRADAIRRERARGRLPLTPERAAARSRLVWQHRRERAAAAGLTMSASEVRELRVRLRLTQKEFAAAIGRQRGSVEHWELGENAPPPAAVIAMRVLAATQQSGENAGATSGERVAPAAAVSSGAPTHG